MDYVTTTLVRPVTYAGLRAPLQSMLARYPMQIVAVDIVGPFPSGESENTYALVASDYYSRWVEAYGIPNQEAEVC